MASPKRMVHLETEVERLNSLDREDLVGLWEKAYGCKPFKGASRKLLVRSAAYALQKQKLVGLKRKTHKRLLQIASEGKLGQHQSAKARLHPGMRLIREWHGRQHTVDVVADGFVWNGETYASLSAIARKITGAHWSGPRFFRL